jgi:DNA-binding CsgD family transcriptional regulator
VNFRLDNQLVQQLLVDYEAGCTGRELAERYGLARSTVIGLLRLHGVAVRYSRVTPEEAAEMVRLYRSGVRQVDIAVRFGRDPGNVWHVLKRAGAFHGS